VEGLERGFIFSYEVMRDRQRTQGGGGIEVKAVVKNKKSPMIGLFPFHV